MTSLMDIKDISKLLPHRYPFLLIDRVVEFEAEKRLVGYKNVTANEEFFNGHFPGHPVMPGVLQLEALAQACAVMAFKSLTIDSSKYVVYLMAIDGAKFRKPVVPGDKLVLTVSTLRHKASVWKVKGEATVDGAVVCEAEFLATVVDAAKAGAST
jgi:3-hydroxyacyl-[acyl-carrier-protein] dehydratase